MYIENDTLNKKTVHFGCCFWRNEIAKASASFWPKIAKKSFSPISSTLAPTSTVTWNGPYAHGYAPGQPSKTWYR